MRSSRQDPTTYVEELRQIKDQLKGQWFSWPGRVHYDKQPAGPHYLCGGAQTDQGSAQRSVILMTRTSPLWGAVGRTPPPMWRSSGRPRISSKVSDFHDQDESIMRRNRQDPTTYVEELRQIKDQLKGQWFPWPGRVHYDKQLAGPHHLCGGAQTDQGPAQRSGCRELNDQHRVLCFTYTKKHPNFFRWGEKILISKRWAGGGKVLFSFVVKYRPLMTSADVSIIMGVITLKLQLSVFEDTLKRPGGV